MAGGEKVKTELKEGLIENKFDPRGLFKKVFAWEEEFDPEESKEVVVTYRMLMGVASANKNNGIYQWKFNGSVPEEGLSVSFMVLFLPSIPTEVGKYYSTSLANLEGTSPEEFKSVLYAYYQNIAFDKQPSDTFANSYFKEVGLVKMPKVFITELDRKNIEEIATNFEELINE